ncbi:hypothetical protein ACEQ8H_007866 [Pleosporales sp. CAS-2024a]
MGVDDVLMSLAMIFVIAIRVYGYQWHVWDQTRYTSVTSRKMALTVELNYLASNSLIKVSILCFYRRMTGSLKTSFLYSVWAMIAFCVVYAIIYALLLIFDCNPVVATFHIFDIVWLSRHEFTCHDEGAIVVSCAILGTIQDLIIYLLPIFLVWNLKMAKKTKIAVCGIFAIGLVTCVCGIMRTYYATHVYYYTYDITWYAYYGWIWTALEANLGVICASAPALKVFFKRQLSETNDCMWSAGDRYARSTQNNTRSNVSRSRGTTGLSLAQSILASRADIYEKHDSIALEGIKVCQNVEIRIETGDDSSQKSFTSTRNLTMQRNNWKSPVDWGNDCHVSSAAPGSSISNDSQGPIRVITLHDPMPDDFENNRF